MVGSDPDCRTLSGRSFCHAAYRFRKRHILDRSIGWFGIFYSCNCRTGTLYTPAPRHGQCCYFWNIGCLWHHVFSYGCADRRHWASIAKHFWWCNDDCGNPSAGYGIVETTPNYQRWKQRSNNRSNGSFWSWDSIQLRCFPGCHGSLGPGSKTMVGHQRHLRIIDYFWASRRRCYFSLTCPPA